MATHSSMLAWEIPWTELGRLQSVGLQRVRHDWVTEHTRAFLSQRFAVIVQLLSRVWLFVTPRTVACQDSLSFTISWRSVLKFMSTESVTLSNHLILCCPLLLLPSIFPRIRVFSNELAFRIRWPKYWSFSFSISPSNEYSGLIPLELTGWISLLHKGLSRVFTSPTVWKDQLFGDQPSL